jgi:two-component system sensor histidine kinase KdpD
MQGQFTSNPTLRWLIATLGTGLLTLLLSASGASETVAGLAYLLFVVWVSTLVGFAFSAYAALLCALAFDYYFLLPLHSFQISGAQQWLALMTFLVSSIVVSRVAERTSRLARQAEQRREDVERLYALSQEMVLHEDAEGLIRDVPILLNRIFELDGVVLYVRDQDQFYTSVESIPPSLQASLRAMTQSNNPTLIMPNEYSAMGLMLGVRQVGALAWKPPVLSREVASSVSAQVGIALTRALAMESSARMEAARESERLRTALIDSLTHELRTPLTSIRAAATTLREGTGLDDASRADLISLVDEESLRLDALIGEAVQMAEIDAHVVQVHKVLQHARTLLHHAVEESRAALKDHRVIIAVEGADEPCWFDPHLLSRVLRHLLENAARYTPPGTRMVLRSKRDGGKLIFTVEDDGPGIDSMDLPLIFEKFYRGKKGSAIGKGSGMGLAITRAILQAHGGSIEVKSRPGQGTTFKFWVPLDEK